MEIKKLKKNLLRFYCEKCAFKCYMKCDWDRHLLRPKHQNMAFGNDLEIKKLKKTYFCECGKEYLSSSGLWKHKTKCVIELEKNDTISSLVEQDQDEDKGQYKDKEKDKEKGKEKDPSDKELIMMLVKQNTELLEVIKHGTHHTTNNNNTINKTFNLQVFLNETCKDAMNIMEFVEHIEIQLGDFLKVGEKGYVEGISHIITSNLKALDVTKRPIHCTDKKRDILYIKDEDKWEKDENKIKIRKAIKKISNKNIGFLSHYKNAYTPDPSTDEYDNLLIETLGGIGENDAEKEDNIIKNISKQVVIEKDPTIIL